MAQSNLVTLALDTQLDLLRWYQTEPGRQYANISCVADPGELETLPTFGEELHKASLMLGDTYAVTGEILDVLESALQSMPPYPLHDSDLPSSGGFVYLERPTILKDGFGKSLAVKALTWHRAVKRPENIGAQLSYSLGKWGQEQEDGDHGVVLLQFTDPRDDRDHMHEEWRDSVTSLIEDRGIRWAPLWSLWGGVWQYGREPEWDSHRFLGAFLRFIEERWVDPRAIDLSRPLFKRAQRHGVPEPRVKIVRLRRRDERTPRNPDVQPVEWAHRWIVEGHWRNQWYPSIQQHRPKYIPSYIKGPSDKPLVIHDKIYLVDR